MTPTLRPHDAGLLETGVAVNKHQIIPPHDPGFVSQGFCAAEILKKGVPAEGIEAFAILQHSHLLGREMTTRHYRNGREIEPMASDKHYDFDFQDMRYLPKKRMIYPGDKLEVKCVYDTTHKQGFTFGGLSTQEEMCLSFIAYYPRMPLELCQSFPLYDTVASDFRHVAPVLRSWNWTDPAVHTKFRTALDNSQHYHYGTGETAQMDGNIMSTEHPTNYPYVKPHDTTCH